MLEASDDIASLLSAELSNMKLERKRLAERLAAIDNSVPTDNIEEMVEATANRFWTLTDDLDKIEPCRLRASLNQMVCRIDLHFDHVQKKTRIECPFSHGTVTLRPDPVLYRLVNRGDWI